MKPFRIVNSSDIFIGNAIGVTGFEPATSCSQSRRSSQTGLHPVILHTFKLRCIQNILQILSVYFDYIHICIKKMRSILFFDIFFKNFLKIFLDNRSYCILLHLFLELFCQFFTSNCFK